MTRYRKLKTANNRGSRLDKLRTLAAKLAASIDESKSDDDSMKTLPSLAKQYRETIKEIEEIENMEDDTDEISEILKDRKEAGLPGAVRK